MNLDDLLNKLVKEKFNDKAPVWKEAKWGDINAPIAQDDKNFYVRHDGAIYVQPKPS